MEYRVIVHAPTGRDASLISSVLLKSEIVCLICTSAAQVGEALLEGAGALITAYEALSPAFWKLIDDFNNNQPKWSDLPIVLLTKKEFESTELRRRYLQLGNVTLLERPVNSVTLVSAALGALRARRRQYDMREIDRRKDEFLAMLAHELRNPLAPISAASEILKAPSLDRQVIRQTSDIISRQVDHMTGLIDDLLDMSRVSRGLIALDLAPVNVGQIVTNAVEQARPLIESRQHHLIVELSSCAAFVLGDHKRLVQIIANLLNNAAKYTPAGGEILLTVKVDESSVIFNVIDNGIGMEPDILNHVFEMFSQAKRNSDRLQGGLGIGLALVKNLVYLHNGSVEAISEGINKGSKLVVKLPRMLEVPSASENSSDPIISTQQTKPKLMIVDDNVDAAKTLAMVLELHGYQTVVEKCAEDAIERSIIVKPDACLLDIGLPDMDGNSLAKILRELPDTSDALLIAITGYGQQEDRKRTAESGFNHHFVKPVNISNLLAILSKIELTQDKITSTPR